MWLSEAASLTQLRKPANELGLLTCGQRQKLPPHYLKPSARIAAGPPCHTAPGLLPLTLQAVCGQGWIRDTRASHVYVRLA